MYKWGRNKKMPKNQDWLDIIEESTQPKKGTKIPKNMDVYSLTMLMFPTQNMGQGNSQANAQMGQASGNAAPSFNLGAGADGVVQPNKPVALDTGTNPASVYHEGETVMPFPGGKKIIPATTEQQQQQLASTQKQNNLPGYATGGTVYDTTTTEDTTTRPTSTYTPTTESNMYQAGVNQAFTTTQNRAAGNDPLMTNIANRALTDYDARAAVSDTAARQSVVSNPYLTEGAKNAVAAKQQATYSAGLSDLTGNLAEQSMTRAEAANTELYSMGQTGLQNELAKEQWQKTFGEQQYQSDIAANQWQKEYETNKDQWQKSFDFEKQKYGDEAFARMASDAETTSLATWLAKYPGATEADYNTAREYKNLQLSSMNIANQTASETLTQLQDSARWNEAQQFLAAGDYTNYAAMVKEITGKDIDTATFQADRQYLETMRGLETQAAEIANDAAAFNLTSATMTAVINDVNNGVPLATINATYNPQPPLTEADYSSISTKYKQAVTAGNLEIQAQSIANDAATLGVSSDRLTAFVNAINSGADLTAANQASGLSLTQAQMDSIATKYQQTVQAAELQLTASELANESTALGISADKLNTFISAVNNGADLAAANAASGLNLTQTQMDSMAAKYQQELQAGALQLTRSEIDNEAAKLGVDSDRLTTFINAVNSGADLAASNAASGLSLNQTQMDSITAKYKQEIALGELQITSAQIANEAATLGVSADQLNTFITAVNNGADLAAANAASGLNLSQSQMDSMAVKYRQTVQIGKLNVDAAELANDATKLGINSDKLTAFITAANNGADLAAANAASGLNLTQSQMDQIQEKYNIGIEEAQLALAETRVKMGDALYESIVSMINSGSSLQSVNAKLAEQGKDPISFEEFQNMYDATALGERNWGRQLTAANMLLSTTGAENKVAAEKAYEALFPSVDFDFSSLVTEENSANFTEGMSSLAEYVAAGLTYQEVKDALKTSGTIEKLGLDSDQVESLYNAMTVNAVDSEWEEMETSDFYQGLSSTEQDELQEFFKQKMLGNLDYTAMHEYEIYNPDGSVYMTLYSKDSTEAEKKAASLGEGYSVNDTGKIKFQVASTLVSDTTSSSTTSESATPTNEAWVNFQDTQADLPASEQISYESWVKAGKPTTYDIYKGSETAVAKIDNLGITNYTDLLTNTNTTKLWDAYHSDPEGVQKSEYYYKLPDAATIDSYIMTTENDAGVHTTHIGSDFQKELEDSYGKLTTVQTPDKGSVTGQITKVYTTPRSVQLVLKLEDGTEYNYILSDVKPTAENTSNTSSTAEALTNARTEGTGTVRTSANNNIYDLGTTFNNSTGNYVA